MLAAMRLDSTRTTTPQACGGGGKEKGQITAQIWTTAGHGKDAWNKVRRRRGQDSGARIETGGVKNDSKVERGMNGRERKVGISELSEKR